MANVTIQADGEKNSQVTPGVKEFLYELLEEYGVSDARKRIVLHHYQGGAFVAVSDFGTAQSRRFSEFKEELATAHPEHRITSDNCVWISRAWLSEQIDSRKSKQR